MNNKSLITILIILIACCIVVGLFCVFSSNTAEENNMTVNNTTNLTNSTNATVVEESSQSYESSSQYQDPHPDWVCEGDSWYSVELSEGHYGIYDKESGRLLGTGDMPDRHGYHSPEYLEDQSSTVKYRSDGEYYSG
ncbi:MAG: hypothetical protein K8V75_01510 [Methanobrevibacter woesei]|uniref:hypothetical protein n=1 Tax=Methanobrevibacter woesei TaxID=190976 RepID=UPI001FA5AB8D|nr:hypothetical protein [Methanobrevibacter woesei]MCC9261035.1 hypothetical protein [Methanobrevibacter woesei]